MCFLFTFAFLLLLIGGSQFVFFPNHCSGDTLYVLGIVIVGENRKMHVFVVAPNVFYPGAQCDHSTEYHFAISHEDEIYEEAKGDGIIGISVRLLM